MTFLSEPSGFTERTRPPLKSSTMRRPTVVLPADARPDFKVCVSVIFALSLVVHVSIFNFQAERKIARHLRFIFPSGRRRRGLRGLSCFSEGCWTLLQERCERLFRFRGAHMGGELLVLELYRPFKLLAR